MSAFMRSDRRLLIAGLLVSAALLATGERPPAGFGRVASAANQDTSDQATLLPATPPEEVLVVVNGRPITAGELDFQLTSRRVPEELRRQVRPRFLEDLIDRRLMQGFLAQRQVEPDPQEVDAYVAQIRELIGRGGDDPDEVLTSFGYTEESLRAELALPLAWRLHVNRIITPAQLREYYGQNREQFDGTQVRASHLLLKVSAEEPGRDPEAMEQRIRDLREEIVSGELTFAEAANRFSEAPSRDSGGDVGFFPYKGKMPVAFTRHTFPLPVGEVSEPFRTPFGWHIAVVTERRPGELSLEDVRPLVFQQLAEEIWYKLVAQQREQATIEWKVRPEE